MRHMLPLTVLALLAACAPTKPARLSEKAREDGVVRVIARLAVEPAATVEAAHASALADMRTMGLDTATTLSESLPLVVADVTPEQLAALEANPRFEDVQEDRLTFASLADSAPLIGAPEVWAQGGRGAGQSVAILDTGVDAVHPFLAGRVTAEACFSTTSAATGAKSVCPNGAREQTGAGAARPCDAEGCEHGTHVAGIAAGRGARFSGVAPDAGIFAVQVFSKFVDRPGGPTPCRDSGQRSPCVASFTSDQIRALDHVRQLAAVQKVASVNMSLGGGRSPGACDAEFIKPAIDALLAAGVATVIASGNNGFADAVSFPSCVSTAVTVGSTTKQDGVSSFSNRGPMLDVYAPGSSINSSVPGAGFGAFSGTSMAAPHVAGAFAALKSARPGASVAEITAALTGTGVTVDRRPRIALAAALGSLPATSDREGAVIAAAASGDVPAEIAALPADRPARVMVRAKDANVARLTAAARSAGVARIETMPGQPVVIIEAKPAQLAAIMRSGAADAMQLDHTARPQ
jgi:subtilisin family serine protease